VSSIGQVPLATRLAQSSLNVVRYLQLTFWPADLIPLYPYPRVQTPLWTVLAAVALVAALTAAAASQIRRRPAVAMGWAWFLVTLFPVLGLLQTGMQTVADRYTYLPHVGFFIALTFALPELRLAYAAAVAASGAAAFM